jgi:hypothetical protein
MSEKHQGWANEKKPEDKPNGAKKSEDKPVDTSKEDEDAFDALEAEQKEFIKVQITTFSGNKRN